VSPPAAPVPLAPPLTAAMVDTMTAAFADEPLLTWWLRGGAGAQPARRRFFRHAIEGGVHPKAQCWTLDGPAGAASAAAIWTPPGSAAFELGFWRQIQLTPLLYQIAGFEGLRRALSLGEMMADYHPHFAHAHLVFLGVHPDCQGQGLGSTMLKHTLAPVDSAGVAAYLETGLEQNVRLYQRHGFEIAAELAAPRGGPRFWSMLRPAKASAR
jgi:ribosomal protein S18 acetylase RimI-like enzyme